MTCFPSFFRWKRASPPRHTPEVNEEVSSSIQSASCTIYSYKELRMATEDFSPGNVVGEGGFGSVYKGTLRDGTVVALKVLSAESRQGVREFLTEINAIAGIEHDNLVKLHGCCVEGKHKILVYEYLENNSLAQTLLGEGHNSGIQFNWLARRGICIGVAKGLAFLHEEVQPYIVHRDIKASNILLDRYLQPRISDFGLAKLFPPNKTHVSTRVAGTAGYLAPEYAIRGQLNRKADVYSFGVLIMEIVSGRCNTNRKLPAGEQYLLEKAWKLHEKGELVMLADTMLGESFDVDEACRYLKIGLLCTQDKPKLRPSMSTVLRMLQGEIDTNEEKITRPGILSEFKGIKVDLGQTDMPESKDSFNALSSGAGNLSSWADMDTSYATMTFNSIYDRSN